MCEKCDRALAEYEKVEQRARAKYKKVVRANHPEEARR
jgi:hypothetical protein